MNTMAFQFDPLVNASALYELYEEDYDYIEEVFRMATRHCKEELARLDEQFHAGSPESIKKTVHKLGPVFGYAGIPQLQEKCSLFENLCQASGSLEEINDDYHSLVREINKAMGALESDMHRLAEFKKNNECP